MNVFGACGMLLPSLTAALAVRAAWPRAELPVALLIALALGLGVGLGAATLWCALLTGGIGRGRVGAFDLALLIAAAVAWLRSRVQTPAEGESVAHRPSPRTSPVGLAGVVAVAALVAAAAFALNAQLHPHGEWDAWAIWNVRARFLFRAGDGWRAAFSPALMHADYPPLLPAAIAHVWTWTGGDPASAPMAVAALFALALPLLIGGALAALRGGTMAWLGSACLLGTPILLQRAAWQYADPPLAFYLLAAVVLLAIADRERSRGRRAGALALLAGLAAGCAALTKNEGALFVLALVLVRGALARRALLEEASFLLGLVPALLLLVHFKLALAPPGYLFADQTAADYLARLGDASRYAQVVGAFGAASVAALGPLLVALPVAALLFGATGDRTARRAAASTGLTVAAIACGYAVVYLVTPLDLAWQLSHSADRLVLHLWPTLLFAVLMAVASPEERLATG